MLASGAGTKLRRPTRSADNERRHCSRGSKRIVVSYATRACARDGDAQPWPPSLALAPCSRSAACSPTAATTLGPSSAVADTAPANARRPMQSAEGLRSQGEDDSKRIASIAVRACARDGDAQPKRPSPTPEAPETCAAMAVGSDAGETKVKRPMSRTAPQARDERMPPVDRLRIPRSLAAASQPLVTGETGGPHSGAGRCRATLECSFGSKWKRTRSMEDRDGVNARACTARLEWPGVLSLP